MKYEKIYLREGHPDVFLETYIADSVAGYKRKAILVIPGGGYGGVCADREGEPIALAFLPYGYNAFVLHYTVGRKEPYPAQIREATMAIKHIKDYAEAYCIDPDQLFVVGFSAGGHLTACAGVFWNRPEVTEGLDVPYGYNKPRGIMPIYPVISQKGHALSLYNLLCKDDPTEEELDYVSVDRHVSADSAPAFIVHSADDELVDARNSLDFALAYANAGVDYELHIFPHAQHGIALGNGITDLGNPKWNDPMIARWVEMAAYWADKICENDRKNNC